MSDSHSDGIEEDNPADSASLDLDTVRILVGRAKAGDDDAHSLLARQVQSYLKVMADRNMPAVLRDHQNVSDIVQKTMIQMINGIGKFRGESTREFYGWLNQILKNESNKATRDLTRQKRDVRKTQSLEVADVAFRNQGAVDKNPSPRSEMIANERIALFHQAMERLSEHDAAVIRLRSLEEKPFKEIAQEMDRSVEAVSKLWVRAMAKLQDELQQLGYDSQIGQQSAD
jgi:RNA polymerase sigma-70 factor (ECF subfamily)